MNDNYIEQLLELVKTLAGQEPRVINVLIAHDDWCKKLTEGGTCDCNPIIQGVKLDTEKNQ